MAGSIITKTADMIQSGREAEQRRTDAVCVLILVDVTAPRSLALPVKEAFDPRLHTAEVRVVGVDRGVDLLAPTPPDVCVVVMGSNGVSVARDVALLAESGVPVAIAVESALDAPAMSLTQSAAERVSILSATSEDVLLERLAEWIIGATDKSVAFSANFPFCRKAKVRELINESARETAALTAKLGPGAELPSMTLSQARLALSIAAINGQPLALGRIPEVLTAVSAGFGSRTLANKALGKLPFVGWFFKVGLGYLGTTATGLTLQHRFEKRELRAQEEANPESVEHHGVIDRVVDTLRERKKRREGAVVRSSAPGEVRLLPSATEGGFLVYEQEEAE